MRIVAISLMAALALAGCSVGENLVGENLVQESSRNAAKRVVTPIVEEKFPARNATLYTDCIIENATTKEIVTLARATLLGVGNRTLDTVVTIATRPNTLTCILKAELVSGLG